MDQKNIMRNIRLLATLCLVFGILMLVGDIFFDTAAFLPRNTVTFAVGFGLIIVGTALAAVWKELSLLRRKMDEQSTKPRTQNTRDG